MAAKKKPETLKDAANARVWSSSLPPALHAAAEKELKRRGLSGRSALVRLAVALLCGDESLAETRMGRPPLPKD